MTCFYRDPYKILGLTSDATERKVQKAYRRLAMQYHPDRNPDNPGAGEKFKQVQWAYETLTGTKKKDSAPNRPGQYEEAFPGDVHPFFGFIWAMRDYSNKKKGLQRND